jgi:Holliday junction resolvase RusA-like endonuclease
MAKRSLKLSVRIPNFQTDARAWRRAIHAAISDVQKRGDVHYTNTDKLQVEICFFLRNPKLTILDLDNRVKDVCDALQGFIYDKGKGGLKPIIPNDNQIYRLIVEKRFPPKVNLASLSTIVIRRYDHDLRTARTERNTRKHLTASS